MSSYGNESEVYDYWMNTPAYDALNLIGNTGVQTIVGIVGIVVAAYVAYSTAYTSKPHVPKMLGNGVSAALVTGLSAYMLLVQLTQFDVAHWLHSITGSLAPLHVMLFAATWSLAVQANSMAKARPGATVWAVFAGLCSIALIMGFISSYYALHHLGTHSIAGTDEWLIVLGLFAGVVIIGLVTRGTASCALKTRFFQHGKGKKSTNRGVARAFSQAAIAFVVFEVALRLLGGAMVNLGPVSQFSKDAIAEQYTKREVQLNLMLKTKRETYYEKDANGNEVVACIFDYEYDRYGTVERIIGRKSSGMLFRISSRQLTEPAQHIRILRALYRVYGNVEDVSTRELNDNGVRVAQCSWYQAEGELRTYWLYNTYRNLNGNMVRRYSDYYDFDFDCNDGTLKQLIKRVRSDYDKNGNNVRNYIELPNGSQIGHWVNEYDAFGTRISQEYYEGDKTTPAFHDTIAADGGWWRVFTDGRESQHVKP